MNLRSTTATAVLGTLLLLLVAAASWLLLLGPATERVGEQREAAADAADRSRLLSTQLARLQARAEDLSGTERADARLAALFPATADQPGFFAQVGAVAREAGYAPSDITSLSPTAPTPVAAPVEPPAAADTGADATDAADDAGDAAAEPAPAAAPDLAVQTVTMTLTGGYDEARRLLRGLERLDRAFLVRSVALAGEAGSPTLTLSVSGTTFVAPPVPAPGSGTDETSQPG